ncbi:hypothetical protein QAD02_006928 [Eretmocerus hayati]|uniref:Uncharacterized protein n=1 Tax=Eretmocerus hayati TaxID=131215 RepID=A0ACC2N320_9HYME|nr:hypothetical protein QAD02_006928 [Eretmocerus hayati]
MLVLRPEIAAAAGPSLRSVIEPSVLLVNDSDEGSSSGGRSRSNNVEPAASLLCERPSTLLPYQTPGGSDAKDSYWEISTQNYDSSFGEFFGPIVKYEEISTMPIESVKLYRDLNFNNLENLSRYGLDGRTVVRTRIAVRDI